MNQQEKASNFTQSDMRRYCNDIWPVLKSYDEQHLGQIAMPLGGIGTGTVSLGGRGQLRDWEIFNQPNKNAPGADNFRLSEYGAASLFVLRACSVDGGDVGLRAVEGVLQPPYEGSHGCPAGFHGVPRFRHCSFHAAYPLAQVCMSDPALPASVRIEAFNPLIPGDADASGIPMAVLRFAIRNTSDNAIDISLCGSLANQVGGGGKRRNRLVTDKGLTSILCDVVGGDDTARDYGTMALATTADDVSSKTTWPRASWRRPLLHFWDDLADDGRLEETPGAENLPGGFGSLAGHARIGAGEETTLTFVIAWHFPNRYNWSPKRIDAEDSSCGCGSANPAVRLNPNDRIGNYYAEQYSDAVDVLRREIPRLERLEADTVKFVNAFSTSDLPETIKEAALFNASTLRTETCFRTPAGKLFGWEGCCDGSGCCHGSCTHVWNYENTTPFLFGDLARTMREVEFLYSTDKENGHMSFRVALPLDREKGKGLAAADGQMGCIMKAYRDWKLSGDDDWLKSIWADVRRALEFCWIPGGWDADQDGVMEGCQHNTMDVEYYGPNPQMGTWYLGALRAAAEMASYLGDKEFAQTCRTLFDNGSAWIDANLFNGEYYEHHIQPPASVESVAEGLGGDMGSKDLANPDLQIGPGCLVDQMVGQYMAHVCGLGYLLNPANVRTTLRSIMKYNYRDNLYDHFNNMRSYALNDEAAILMCSFPRGGRPASPFPYFNEVMTGFEYCAATHMLYEGLDSLGLKAVQSIRNRYDGRRRSPFNEAECGHHYARAMAAWTGVLALTGFQYDGTSGSMTFARSEQPVQWFWSSGAAWGTFKQTPHNDGLKVELNVLQGTLPLRTLTVGNASFSRRDSEPLTAGEKFVSDK